MQVVTAFLIVLQAAVLQCQILSPDQCKQSGFTSALECSSCSQLKQFGLSQLDQACQQCCKGDSLDSAKLSNRPSQFPGLSTKYKRGAEPVIRLMQDEAARSAGTGEEFGIDRWDTDTLEEFLRERLL
uniref:Selenoprotein F n=1 Tax=Macrostomum lignano TaxID=282301 RepID=A0A1I8GQE5_9PLAT